MSVSYGSRAQHSRELSALPNSVHLQEFVLCTSVLHLIECVLWTRHSRGPGSIIHWFLSALCNTLQHNATHSISHWFVFALCNTLHHTASHCNTLQHTAIHCNTLQHTRFFLDSYQYSGTHYNTPQHTATHCNTLQHTATHRTTQKHTATHCNTLQHSTFLWFLSGTPPPHTHAHNIRAC